MTHIHQQQVELYIFRKFSTRRKLPEISGILNITDNPGTTVDLDKTIHACKWCNAYEHIINHENNVLLLVHKSAVTVTM